MSPIPLDSFRIIKKKSNWEKSCDEIVQDDSEDIDIYMEYVSASNIRFYDSKTELLGPWEKSADDLAIFWLKHFHLLMRLSVKNMYVMVGESNRGIPSEIVKGHGESILSVNKSLDSLVQSTSINHLIFMFIHLFEQEGKVGKQAYFDLLFEEQYLSCVKIAHQMASENVLFTKNTVDINKLERDLRLKWIIEYKSLWAGAQ